VPPPPPQSKVDVSREKLQAIRDGMWLVVNGDRGTARRARIEGKDVCGKTGTAQVMTDGKKDTIAWFAYFAPYDKPRYAIAVMVQGGAHGGSVAAPIATRILERALAMEDGRFEQEMAWVAPASKPNPFQMIEAVTFKDSGPNVPGGDEENLDQSDNANVQMSPAGAEPDVEPEADSRGKVAQQRALQQRAVRAMPAAAPTPKPNIFQRLFGSRPAPQPAPPPARRGAPPRKY
jgi:penicillin-binding protein 2